MKDKLLKKHGRLLEELEEGGWHSAAKVIRELIEVVGNSSVEVEGDPAAWMFQHDDTGRATALVNDGINNPNNFVDNNPRYGGKYWSLYRRKGE